MNGRSDAMHRQRGATLVIALILLTVLTILGVSTMSTARFAKNLLRSVIR